MFSSQRQYLSLIHISLSDDYQNYLKAAAQDEEKKKDLIYLLAQDIKMPLSNILMYLEFLHKETRISPEIQKDFVIPVSYTHLDVYKRQRYGTGEQIQQGRPPYLYDFR